MGKCLYRLLELCEDDPGPVDFNILQRTEQYVNNPAASVTKELVITIGPDVSKDVFNKLSRASHSDVQRESK